MECPNGHGTMRAEDINDYHGGTSFPGWRCVYCGEILDELILKNRKISAVLAEQGIKPNKRTRWNKKLVSI